MTHPLVQRLRDRLWEREPASPSERQLMYIGRYVMVLARDLMDGQLSMRAMSMVYTTLLSLVPLLALAFSLFKALGIHNALEPVLLQLLAPLGAQGAEVARSTVAFVEKIQVGVLGSLGVGLLFYTVVSMLQKIESSFNYVWRIEIARKLGQRFGEYLSVIIVGPVLVFSALGMTASVMNSKVLAAISSIEPFGVLIYIAGKLVPYLLIIGAFTFFYSFIPNTRVRFRAALAGGVLAGVLWQTGSLAFATFVAGASNYNAIYSGFAIVIFLLIWLYLGWLILLIGCHLSYYVQHPERLTAARTAPHLSARLTELLGLQIMAAIGRRFLAGEPGYTLDDLRRSQPGAAEHVDRVVEILQHNGLLVEATGAGASETQQLLPARDLGSLSVADLWQQLRRGFDGTARTAARDELSREVHHLLDAAESGFAKSAGKQSVRDWLTAKE
jgi:membrane protein